MKEKEMQSIINALHDENAHLECKLERMADPRDLVKLQREIDECKRTIRMLKSDNDMLDKEFAALLRV